MNLELQDQSLLLQQMIAGQLDARIVKAARPSSRV